jgi:hypothetical protein
MTKPVDPIMEMILDDMTKVADREIAKMLPKPAPLTPILVDVPRHSSAELEREQRAYVARLERRNQELEVEIAELRPKATSREKIDSIMSGSACLRSANERIEELEGILENSILLSPFNAKLILQFVPKPTGGDDWEVDATIDVLWKELAKQAAKA